MLCWWIYRGGAALLAVIVLGNLANMSFFFAGVPGPEQLLAGHPMLVVTVVFVQIVNNARPDRPDLVESCNDTSRASSYVERQPSEHELFVFGEPSLYMSHSLRVLRSVRN